MREPNSASFKGSILCSGPHRKRACMYLGHTLHVQVHVDVRVHVRVHVRVD